MDNLTRYRMQLDSKLRKQPLTAEDKEAAETKQMWQELVKLSK